MTKYDETFQRIREGVPSVSETLYHALRHGILSGDLAPGQHLVERQIARDARVSRSPIREAFRRLEAEGLIWHRPRRGVEVLGLPPERIEDVFAVRRVLQSLISERAAVNASEEDIEGLGQAVREAEQLVDHPDGFQITQDQFNNTLMKAAKMPLAADFLRQIEDYHEEFRSRALWNRERRIAAAAEHRAIWEALKRHDPVATRQATEIHVDRSEERALSVVKPEPQS